MEQWSRASAPALQRIIKAACRWEWWRAGKAGATRWMANQPAGKSSLLYWRVQNVSLRDLWSCGGGGERPICSDIRDGNVGFACLSSCLCVVSGWFTSLICMTILGTITRSPLFISVATVQFIMCAFVLPALTCHFSALDTEETPMKWDISEADTHICQLLCSV